MSDHAVSEDGLVYQIQDGDGTPVVFVHGWLGNKDSWANVAAQSGLERPRLFYDQRCHGDSTCRSFDFEDLANDLSQLITECGLDQPIIAGHSMGGMVAVTYAIHYDNVSGLFLAGTCASTPEPVVESPQFFLDELGTMERERWARMIVENYAPADSMTGQVILKELVAADEEPLRYGLESMISYDVRDELQKIDVLATVIAGENDQAITMKKSTELADILDCPLIQFDTSHLLLHEATTAVAEELAAFVERCS